VEKILTHAASRVPVLAEAGVNPRRAWAGLYEMTPDHHAIIGPAPNVAGLFFVNGFSGHGVMHSPRPDPSPAIWCLHGASKLLTQHRWESTVSGRPAVGRDGRIVRFGQA
jgi:sarcosine oxidase subunit beta